MSGGVPHGEFVRLARGPLQLIAVADLARAAWELGLLEPGRAEALLGRGGGSMGRAGTAVVALAGRRERLHLRPVRHGGLLARLWGDRVLGLGRSLRELEATARLRRSGAPVPAPALVVARRRFGPLWRIAVGTVHEENAVDGLRFLFARPDRGRVLAAAAAAGRSIRRLHELGGRHTDLHLKNVLIREVDGRTECVLVDLDRARVGSTPTARERVAELMRLYRSLRKRGLLDVVGVRGCARFLSAYVDGDRALRRALRRHLRRERLRVTLHALAYRQSR